MKLKQFLSNLKEHKEELLSIIPGILKKDICITIKNPEYMGVKAESIEIRISEPLTEKEKL